MKSIVKFLLVTPLVVTVAACSTPRQSCIADVTSDYRALQTVISEAEMNIARGYAVHSQRVPYTVPQTCYRTDPDTGVQIPYSCPETAYRTEETPVAINVAEERRKLAGYRRILPELRSEAEAGTQTCIARHPE